MKKEIKINASIILYNRLRNFVWPFSKKIPLREKGNVSFNPFFIIGSGRSGTTLLRAILNQSPSIVIPPESFVLPILYKRYQVYNTIPWKDFVKIILGEFAAHSQFKHWNIDITPSFKELAEQSPQHHSLNKIIESVYQTYGRKHQKENVLFGDKTPLNTFYIKYLEKIFLQPKYIHMYRDGRDVAASFIKNNIYDSIDEVAKRWLYSIEKVEKFRGKYPERLLEIKYEDLVTTPQEIMINVCEFLDIELTTSMFSYYENAHQLGDSHFNHHQNLKKPLNDQSIGKWKEFFSPDDQKKLNRILQPKLQELGYS